MEEEREKRCAIMVHMEREKRCAIMVHMEREKKIYNGSTRTKETNKSFHNEKKRREKEKKYMSREKKNLSDNFKSDIHYNDIQRSMFIFFFIGIVSRLIR
jgi:hypothetical protein